MAKPLSPAAFQEEAQRRLIDAFDVMLLLGLRSRAGVWNRVENGTLPPPIYRQANIVALWDRDSIPVPDDTPDRKE